MLYILVKNRAREFNSMVFSMGKQMLQILQPLPSFSIANTDRRKGGHKG